VFLCLHGAFNLQDLESLRPRAILDIIQAASELRFVQDSSSTPAVVPKACNRCGYMTSQVVLLMSLKVCSVVCLIQL
jgi:hypothetical protein